jgi:hypothetical protein
MTKRLGGLVIVILLFMGGGIGLALFPKTAGPLQPVAFSHKVHAGDYKIDCQYCHVYARKAAVAGIPSVQRCMGCHKITAVNDDGVKKLKGYWDRKEPIRWTKVTWMPDFVFFEHAPHIRSGISCNTCHGPVETMEQARPAADLTMRGCIACHRERKVSIDCVICHR